MIRKFNKLNKKNEAFKNTDPLSPSETAAVCSQWSRRAGDSFKYDDGEFISFQTTLRDSYFGMDITVSKETGDISCLFLNMNNDEMIDTVSQYLDQVRSTDDCDDIWNELTTDVGEDLNNEANYCSSVRHLSGHSTRIEVEEFLDECEDISRRSEKGLEAEFYAYCEAKESTKESLRRRISRLEKAIKSERYTRTLCKRS